MTTLLGAIAMFALIAILFTYGIVAYLDDTRHERKASRRAYSAHRARRAREKQIKKEDKAYNAEMAYLLTKHKSF